MKHVLIFSISDALGGAEQVLFKLAKYYSIENKVKVVFFKKKTTNYWIQNLESEVEVFYLNNNILFFCKYVKRYFFYRVFSSHLMVNSFLGFLRGIKILNTEKLIVRESTGVFERYSGFKLIKYKIAYYFGYKGVSLIICQTKLMFDGLKFHVPFLFNYSEVKVISNPFDFPINENDLFVCDYKDYIVSAGRLIPEKGYDILIESFSKLKRNKKYADLKLVILGEGIEKDNLSNQVQSLGLGDSVVFKGFVDNVYPYFKKAKLCVVSSRIEGFPNVLLQMMSQNNKVVSTTCAGGIQEIKGVFVCDTNNKNELADAMKKALDSETESCRNLFDQFLKARSIDNFVYKIESIIDEK